MGDGKEFGICGTVEIAALDKVAIAWIEGH